MNNELKRILYLWQIEELEREGYIILKKDDLIKNAGLKIAEKLGVE